MEALWGLHTREVQACKRRIEVDNKPKSFKLTEFTSSSHKQAELMNLKSETAYRSRAAGAPGGSRIQAQFLAEAQRQAVKHLASPILPGAVSCTAQLSAMQYNQQHQLCACHRFLKIWDPLMLVSESAQDAPLSSGERFCVRNSRLQGKRCVYPEENLEEISQL